MITNPVWPSLYLTESLSSWCCLAISVLIQGLILWHIGKLRWWKAIIGTFVANGTTTFIGVILLLPLLGLWLEAFAGLTYNNWLHLGTFNLLTWILTWLLAITAGSLIASVALWMCCLANWSRRFVVSVVIANTATVIVACLLLFYFPQTIR
ncbi:MAG: hypothetical protein LBH01_01750 [Verrucomicrobiales bacterium]|jgi:hypothetical protein|nr:hypothetical protein [Verrucomicrobiales bacterium]